MNKKRYFEIYGQILKLSVMNLLEWRGALFIWTFVHILELFIYYCFFQIILSRVNIIGGWGINELIILLGYMECLHGMGGLTFYPMMYEFGEKVRGGELDFKLTKPLDIQFQITFPWLDLSDIFSVFTGVGLMIYGISNIPNINLLLSVPAFIILFISSMFILYSIILLLLTLCFKSTKFDAVADLYYTVLWVGKYPVSIYKGGLNFVLMFIIPIGMVTMVPVQFLVGVFDLKLFSTSIILATSLFFVGRKIFLSSVKSYSSASS